jgi:hypothetical protein
MMMGRQERAAGDDATDNGRNINIDVYLDIDQWQRNEAEEGAKDEEEVLWRQHCSLIWPIDILVRVRADSDFPNQTSTDAPPPYKVLLSIPESGLALLVLAFRERRNKAPERIWHFCDELAPYTDSEHINEDHEGRSRRALASASMHSHS